MHSRQCFLVKQRTRIRSAGSSRSQGSAPAATSNPSTKTISKIRNSLHQLQAELRLSLESLDKAVSETDDYDGGESSLSVDTISRRRSYSGISDLDPEEYSHRVKQWSHQVSIGNYSESESYTTDSSLDMNESRRRKSNRIDAKQQAHQRQSEKLIQNLQKEILTSLTDDQSDNSFTEGTG